MAAPPAAARDDLRFRVLELRRDPGGHHGETRLVSLPTQRVGDAQPTGDPVEVTVDLEAVSDGVRVTGTVEFAWEGSCRRCLELAGGRASSTFSEMFVDDPERWVASEGVEDDDVHPIDDGWVDLSTVVRDAVLLGLPLAPLCSEDCPGPAPGEFPVGTGGDGERDGEERGVDPRWAKLSEVRFEEDAAD
jgi:uncharacterized protein